MYSLGRILGILANQHKNGKLILEMKQLESEHHVLCYTMFHPWPPPPSLLALTSEIKRTPWINNTKTFDLLAWWFENNTKRWFHGDLQW